MTHNRAKTAKEEHAIIVRPDGTVFKMVLTYNGVILITGPDERQYGAYKGHMDINLVSLSFELTKFVLTFCSDTFK